MKYEITLRRESNDAPEIVKIEADDFNVSSTNGNLYFEHDDKCIAVFRDWNYIKEV